MLVSNEYIKMVNVDTNKEFICKPQEEFIKPMGKFRAWNEARLFDSETKETAFVIKAGSILETQPETKAKRERKARVAQPILIEEDDD